MRIGFIGIPELIIVLVLLPVLVAWLLAINLFIKVGAEKGYAMENKGLLWFIGIFATPIVVGLYIASLPDARAIAEPQTEPKAEDLPEL